LGSVLYRKTTVSDFIADGVFSPLGRHQPNRNQRIRRRARALADVAFEHYCDAIVRELNAGTLDADFIEMWLPTVKGETLHQRLNQAHDALHAALRAAAILFP
jgi:hypothetical protein